MVIGKGLEALDWDTSEAAGWLRVEADGGGSWLVRIRLFLPKHWIIFSNGTWTYDICVAFWCRYLIVCFIFEWSCILLDDLDDKWWTMKDDWEMMNHERWMMDDDDVDDDDVDDDDDDDVDDDDDDDGMMDCLIDWLNGCLFACLFVLFCLFCFVLFVCLFVCPKPFWSLEVLWLRVCDLHIIIEKNHCICSMIWIELALPYSLQGLDRWKRQLVSVLRDGHALLTTLNEGATLSGSMVT